MSSIVTDYGSGYLSITGSLTELGLDSARYTLTDPATASSKVVAALDPLACQWAAYLGPGDWSIMKVARHGMKLRYEEARRLFPILNPEKWRA